MAERLYYFIDFRQEDIYRQLIDNMTETVMKIKEGSDGGKARAKEIEDNLKKILKLETESLLEILMTIKRVIHPKEFGIDWEYDDLQRISE
jgi:hypothetical protein